MALPEYWDIYDSDKRLTGRTMLKHDYHLNDDEYHMIVLGIVQRTDGKYLLTKRKQNKRWGAGLWEVPGGACISMESSEEAAKREVFEETGIHVAHLQDAYCFSYRQNNPGTGDNYFVDIFKFIVDFKESDIRICSDEADGYMLASAAQIQELGANGLFLHYDKIKEYLR